MIFIVKRNTKTDGMGPFKNFKNSPGLKQLPFLQTEPQIAEIIKNIGHNHIILYVCKNSKQII